MLSLALVISFRSSPAFKRSANEFLSYFQEIGLRVFKGPRGIQALVTLELQGPAFVISCLF